MTEAIVCAVIAAIAAVTVGLINAFSQKKTKQDLSAEFQKELQTAAIMANIAHFGRDVLFI